ncbi:putative geranylgeranyl diphosphate synthase [Podospora didyma]|uniref:Geranylgeranyl diphosphate synthase n=1 Tax=Podospora didyma TaxID=330526 RepID=A0AAE0NX49_9PEZI|nr:putative geranylgeranyl diphosphate synthase [Podospora didyma]
MEFKYSYPVDPSEYDDDGLCRGYPLRNHRDAELVDLGTLRAQENWRRLVGPLGIYKGGLGPKFNFVSLALPECLPDRIEVIAYLNEMVFIHDDGVEDVSKQQGDELNDVLVDGFRLERILSAQSVKNGKRKMQQDLVKKLVAIDKERALKAISSLTEYFAKGSGRRNHTEFRTLDEFMRYRILDVGKMYWVGCLTFAMALTIPDDEMESLSELCHPAWLSCGLINDLYSWPKERDAAAKKGVGHVNNSVWVLMKEHKIDETEAIARLRGRIRVCFVQHQQKMKESNDRTDISADVKRFMEAMQYSMAANVVWSRSCPRYNEGRQFNERARGDKVRAQTTAASDKPYRKTRCE